MRIKLDHSYAVRAEIKIDDRVAFTTTRNYPVLTNGAPRWQVEVQLDMVDKKTVEEKLKPGEWLLEDLGGAGVMDNLQTKLKFYKPGTLVGSGGCNRYFAGYKIEGDNIKIEPIASTNMACLPAVMEQEGRYIKALQEAYRIRVEGAFLYIDCRGLEKPLKFTRLEAD